MALRHCHECDGAISTEAVFCPHCGYPNTKNTPPSVAQVKIPLRGRPRANLKQRVAIYFMPQGRIGRVAYILRSQLDIIMSIVVAVPIGIIFQIIGFGSIIAYTVGVLAPYIYLAFLTKTKRFHDFGYSARRTVIWFILLLFIMISTILRSQLVKALLNNNTTLTAMLLVSEFAMVLLCFIWLAFTLMLIFQAGDVINNKYGKGSTGILDLGWSR
jgi:uncharacterized membrane protein YhaH (DUF805 family)